MTDELGFTVHLTFADRPSRRVATVESLSQAASVALDLAERLGERAVWLDHGSPAAVEVRSPEKLELSVQVIPGGLIRRRDTRSRSR
jgi:hypothetical protein